MFKHLVVSAFIISGGIAAIYMVDDDVTQQWFSRAGLEIEVAPIRATIDGWLMHAGDAASVARASPAPPAHRFDRIGRADVLSTVAATGALAPVATIQIGSTVAGQVDKIYADFNSEVRRNDPLALIDPMPFRIMVDQARADFDVARASVETQISTIERMESALANARFEHLAAEAKTEAGRVHAREAAAEAGRKESLARTISAAELQRARSAHEAALAELRATEALEGARGSLVQLAEAELRAARSQLVHYQAVARQREAALQQAELELERTVIRSPVDGVVIQRNVEVGQAAGGTLFTIAQDLREMQVNASVDESEIGLIAPGQRVEFTVDAFTDRRFSGTVNLIRKTPQTVQNVVTYTVVVKARNPDMLLLPGMTASARFIIAESRDVLTVPNAALRFQPPEVEAPPGRHVWIEDRARLRPIRIEIGLTDGTRTEVSGEGLTDGMQVITGMERPREEPSTAKRLIGIF